MDDYMGENPLNKMVPCVKKGCFLLEPCGSCKLGKRCAKIINAETKVEND
jgi:hypothetical protein